MPKKLTKMPIDVEALLSSSRFRDMKDFKKWWFMAILFAMWNQRMPGHLEITENLYQIVGAHSRPMWEQHGGEVMAAFERVERDGKPFLYSAKVEALWNEMQVKYAKQSESGKKGGRRSRLSTVVLSISSLPIDSIYQDCWKRTAKAKALKAIEKAIQLLMEKKLAEVKDRFGNTRMFPIEEEISAAKFLHESVLEFASSPAGKDHGLWEQYTSPYPASWFNAQRFLDDRSTWYVGERPTQQTSKQAERISRNRDNIAGAIQGGMAGGVDGQDAEAFRAGLITDSSSRCGGGLGESIRPDRPGTISGDSKRGLFAVGVLPKT